MVHRGADPLVVEPADALEQLGRQCGEVGGGRVRAGLLGLTKEVTLVNRSDFYDERYPFGTLVPAVATDTFTVVGTGSGPGL